MQRRLSDEIMDGSFYRRHVDHVSYIDDTGGCALQLGQVGRGDMSAVSPTDTTRKTHKWTTKQAVCPECGIVRDYASVIGNCLNDLHKWNLSKIVDYIRSAEPVEPGEKQLYTAEKEEVEYASIT
jgi:hypothetical protein